MKMENAFSAFIFVMINFFMTEIDTFCFLAEAPAPALQVMRVVVVVVVSDRKFNFTF